MVDAKRLNKKETKMEKQMKEIFGTNTYSSGLEKTPDIAKLCRILKVIGKILIALIICWVVGKTIFRIGYMEGMRNDKACQDRVDWAIQDTSDELLKACEAKIDEITLKYEQEIDSTQDRCLDIVEDAVEEAKQEILAQF